MNFKPIIIITGGFVYVSCISNDMKTKTFEWHKYLLKNPELILSKLCKILDVSFDEKMLEWKKGARKEDGVWAKYWYKNIHNSTGFLPYAKKAITLTGSNAELAEECLPYYKFLTAKSIQL